jgi:hypothetical protein
MANLIVNGGFSIGSSGTIAPASGHYTLLPGGSTAIDGWTVIGGPAGDDQLYWFGSGFDDLVSPDADAIALTGDSNKNPEFGVEQIIATTPGMTYALTFDVGTSSQFPDPSGAGVSVTAGNLSTTITGITTTGTDVWTPEEVDFTATSTATAIVIQGDASLPNVSGEYVGLDNVAVNPTTNAAPPVNLVTNGSFELASPVTALPILPGTQDGPYQGSTLTAGSTAILGWTVTGSGAVNWIPNDNEVAESTPFGVYFLNLADNAEDRSGYQGGAPYDGVTQTIATTPGTTYQLTFDIGNDNTSANTGVLPTGNGIAEASGSAAMPGWTVIGGTAAGNDGLAWLSNANSYGLTAETGSTFVSLAGYHDNSPYFGVSQTIATTAGLTYALTFYLGVDNSSAHYTGPIGVAVTAGSVTQTIENVSPTGSGNQWVEETVDFTATAAASTIAIQGVQGNQYIGLDNVSVVQTGSGATGTDLIANGDFSAPSIDPVGVSVTAGPVTTTFNNVDPTALGNAWTPETVDFTATSTTSTIAIAADQGQNYVGLDDVVVTAVAPAGPDVFSDMSAASSGPFTGNYLWSNPANWSQGLPVDGDAATIDGSGFDDLPSLSLSSLDLPDANVEVDVVGSSLTVGTVTASGDTTLLAAASYAGAPVTVTVGAIGTSGASYGALGAGGSFIDNSATDMGNSYQALLGGLVELVAPPSDGSQLSFNNGAGTFALQNPAASNAVAIQDLAIGDTLELPGSSVSNVSFGTSSLTVTTSAGTYAFTNVTYFGTLVTGFTAAHDSTTGLEAITFTGPDVFTNQVAASSGPNAGRYLWSNPANWSQGLPVDGGSVEVDASGIDDLAALSLTSLSFGDNTEADVVGGSLTVGTLTGGADTLVIADANAAGAPVTVTVGATGTFSDGNFRANGAAARFIDNSTTDAGNSYQVVYGGFLELAARPSALSDLSFSVGTSTFALENPGATNAVAIDGLADGDTLELPGTSVSNVGFGTNSLTVTTSAGTYAFTNVTYLGTPPTGFTAALDSTTGLEAITFVTADVFSDQVAASGGLFLWSNAGNWSSGVPADGDAAVVVAGAYGIDDLAALSLTSLSFGDNTEADVVGGSLTVGTLTGGADTLVIADANGAGAPVTVTVGATGASSDGNFRANGATARFIDNSTTDAGNSYQVAYGGFLELAARPSALSDLYFTFGTGTFALENPGASNAVAIQGLTDGDTLELPGSSVSTVTFGANSLTVTTSAGTYAFSNVSYAAPVTGFTATHDSTTGLEAITFTGPDVFSDLYEASGGLFLWSNAGNWSSGVPADGDAAVVVAGAYGIDDLAALSLTSLSFGDNTEADVVGGSLTVGTLTGGADTLVIADANGAGAPVTVTVGATGASSDGNFRANGATARFIDNSTTDAGNSYQVAYGGFLELAARPSALSDLYFTFGTGTFALENPGASNAVAIQGLTDGDTLELPGSSVSTVTFGANSLTVTTSAGTYAFSNVSYAAPVTGFTATHDSTTGLEAITFTGPDVFSDLYEASGGLFLWSNAGNWSSGVPADGEAVATTGGTSLSGMQGVDDVTRLSLATLTQASFSTTEIETGLTIGTLVNNGTLLVDNPGTVTVTGAASGTGVIVVDPSTIEFDGPVGAGQTVTLEGAGAVLRLDDPQHFDATIGAFAAGDSIVVNALDTVLTGASLDQTGHILTLIGSVDGGSAETLGAITFANAITTRDFGTEGNAVDLACFAAGTRLATPAGPAAVEQLAVGDRVTTLSGGSSEIVWVGSRVVACARHPRPETVWPVRIAKDAFGACKPSRDVFLSPDHAVFVDGLLIAIRQLVNGTTIAQVPRDDVTYFHVELARHDILVAEGLPAESYRDTGNRAAFANAGAPTMLHPDFARRDDTAAAYAPLAVGAEQVEPVWRRLAARAAESGTAVSLPEVTTDPRLRLVVDGREMAPVEASGSRCVFVLPPRIGRARITSRAAAPTDLRPWLDDRRKLGVPVSRIVLRDRTGLTDIPADHPALHEGWHDVEQDANRLWRWTDGDAVIPLAAGTRMIEVHLGGYGEYPVRPEKFKPPCRAYLSLLSDPSVHAKAI